MGFSGLHWETFGDLAGRRTLAQVRRLICNLEAASTPVKPTVVRNPSSCAASVSRTGAEAVLGQGALFRYDLFFFLAVLEISGDD
jgi:hypothetical protein